MEENWSVMRLLSKELVRSGEADTIAQRIEARKQAVQALQRDKEAISQRVAQVIVDEVGDTLTQEIESESKEFVDNLIKSLGTDREADVHLTERESASVETETQFEEEEYVITFYEDSSGIQSFMGDNQSDVMAEAVDFLVPEYDLIEQLDPFPYQ